MDGEVLFKDKIHDMRFADAERIAIAGRVDVLQDTRIEGAVLTHITPAKEGEEGVNDIRGIKQEMASLKAEIKALRDTTFKALGENTEAGRKNWEHIEGHHNAIQTLDVRIGRNADEWVGADARLLALECLHPRGKSHEVTVGMRPDPAPGQVIVSHYSGARYRVVGYDGPYIVTRLASDTAEQALYVKFTRGEFDAAH